MDEVDTNLQEDNSSKHSEDESVSATNTDTSNNSKEQDDNTNIDDYTQGIVDSEEIDKSNTEKKLRKESLEHIKTAIDKTAESSNDLDSGKAIANSDNNDSSAMTIEDDKDSTVEDIYANSSETESMIVHVGNFEVEDSQGCLSGGHWSGSGVWERTENRRWIAVHQHRIPNRIRSISESSLVTDLGTGQFVNRFEFAEPSDNSENSDQFKIVVSKESMIRLNATIASEDYSVPGPSSSQDVPGPSSPHDDPVPGPSSAPQSGDSNLVDTPERAGASRQQQDQSRLEASRINAMLHRTIRRAKNKRKNSKKRAIKRRRNRNLQRMLGQSQQQRPPRRREGGADTQKTRIILTRSADSSPGRDTPSPTSLSRICLYWEKRLASPEYVILSDPESEP